MCVKLPEHLAEFIEIYASLAGSSPDQILADIIKNYYNVFTAGQRAERKNPKNSEAKTMLSRRIRRINQRIYE